jgi:hypothetical protein
MPPVPALFGSKNHFVTFSKYELFPSDATSPIYHLYPWIPSIDTSHPLIAQHTVLYCFD